MQLTYSAPGQTPGRRFGVAECGEPAEEASDPRRGPSHGEATSPRGIKRARSERNGCNGRVLRSLSGYCSLLCRLSSIIPDTLCSNFTKKFHALMQFSRHASPGSLNVRVNCHSSHVAASVDEQSDSLNCGPHHRPQEPVERVLQFWLSCTAEEGSQRAESSPSAVQDICHGRLPSGLEHRQQTSLSPSTMTVGPE